LEDGDVKVNGTRQIMDVGKGASEINAKPKNWVRAGEMEKSGRGLQKASSVRKHPGCRAGFPYARKKRAPKGGGNKEPSSVKHGPEAAKKLGTGGCPPQGGGGGDHRPGPWGKATYNESITIQNKPPFS